jgi:hypothetical protein
MCQNAGQSGAGGREQKVECFCLGAGPELFALFKKFGPESAMRHFRNARIELLKGFRELIDQRIRELSALEEKKGTKVSVE